MRLKQRAQNAVKSIRMNMSASGSEAKESLEEFMRRIESISSNYEELPARVEHLEPAYFAPVE